MKRLIILICFIPIILNGQKGDYKAEVLYQNGSTEEAFIKLPILTKKKHLKIKKDEQSKSEKIALDLIKTFSIKYEELSFDFFIDHYDSYGKKGVSKKSKRKKILYLKRYCESISLFILADEYSFKKKKKTLISRAKSHSPHGIAQLKYLLKRNDELPYLIPDFDGLITLGWDKNIVALKYFENDEVYRIINTDYRQSKNYNAFEQWVEELNELTK